MNRGHGEQYISTDVLVIGGGMAGMFAAIKVRERGLDVTITDKAYIGKAGATHFAEGDTMFFRPERGHKPKDFLELISERCEYINNREWDEIHLKESKDRHDDLASWGVQFYEEDGKPYIFNYSKLHGAPDPWEDITMVHRKYAPTMRKKVEESGIRVLDRIMICELLKQGGKVVGAVGFNITSGDLYILQAKATVLATGGGSFKTGGWHVDSLTADGDTMAYMVGAELVGKEFIGRPLGSGIRQKRQVGDEKVVPEEINYILNRFPFAHGHAINHSFAWATLNAEGEPISNMQWDIHSGRAPFYHDPTDVGQEQIEWFKTYQKRIGTHDADKLGLDILNIKSGKILIPATTVLVSNFASPGIWTINTSCATSVPGLFAAGNSGGTMASGATYAGLGFGLTHAMVTGARAGLGAAEYASKSKKLKVKDAELLEIKKNICAPMERIGGFSSGWLTQVLHGIIVPYYIFTVKHGDRLQAALTLVEFLSKHLVPKLMAKDPHEWRLVYETRNMVLNAEMILRASLFRTESRGGHFREDYPRRDDPSWLAWVKVKNEQGEMKLFKEPVPKKWWPDLSKPYEERYPRRFPGE